MKNKSHYLLYLVLWLVLPGFQCEKECKDQISENIGFKAILEPVKDQYNVGDTIYLSTSFDASIGLSNMEEYDNSNKRIDFVVQLFESNGNGNEVIDAVNQFDVSSSIGNIGLRTPFLKARKAIQLDVTCDDNCGFGLKLIPKQSGLFCLGLRSGRIAAECVDIDYFHNEFDVDDNNYKVWQAIGTNNFILNNSIYNNPDELSLFYFFKVK